MIDKETLRQTELDKLFGALNTTQDLRLRMGIFIGTVNLAVVGSGFTYDKPYLLLIAACLMPIFIFSDVVLLQNIYSYYYRAKRILKSIDYDTVNYFDMFMQIFNTKIKITIQELVELDNEDIAIKRLRKLPYLKPTLIGFWGPIAIFISEILVGFISVH